MWNNKDKGTYIILFFIIHEGGNGPTLVGVRPGLSTNTDGGTVNAEVVGSSRDSAEGGRH